MYRLTSTYFIACNPFYPVFCSSGPLTSTTHRYRNCLSWNTVLCHRVESLQKYFYFSNTRINFLLHCSFNTRWLETESVLLISSLLPMPARILLGGWTICVAEAQFNLKKRPSYLVKQILGIFFRLMITWGADWTFS